MNATNGVLDLGAGQGQYSSGFKACGLAWRGYDGAENVASATKQLVQWLDLFCARLGWFSRLGHVSRSW